MKRQAEVGELATEKEHEDSEELESNDGGSPGPSSGEDVGLRPSTAALEDAVREALSGPAQEIANQIAQSSRLKWQATLGTSPLMDAAVREALSGPAQEIANQIAQSSRLKWQATLGTSPLMDAAVREALSGPAQKIANQISETSLGWLRNYSGQTLEPKIFAEVARILAIEQIGSPQSDYEPVSIEIKPEDMRTAPALIFERYEATVKSLAGLTTELDRLTRRLAPLTISWRGQADADWGLYSTLYRQVQLSNDMENRDESVHASMGNGAPPSEEDMVSAERYLLTEVSDRWRLGNSPAIELLARMQHRGISTRLLDATRHPLTALWFAVSDRQDTDARLFAIAHRPIPHSADPETKSIDQALWYDQHPFWFDFRSPIERVIGAWGTGTRLREVVPPEYDKRILAQNAVFLLDGVPALTGSVLERFNEAVGGSWTAADIALSMSVVLAPGDPSRIRLGDSDPLSLVYSFRIPAKLKRPIQAALKRTFGLDWESVYPDMDGIKGYLKGTPDWVRSARVRYPPQQV